MADQLSCANMAMLWEMLVGHWRLGGNCFGQRHHRTDESREVSFGNGSMGQSLCPQKWVLLEESLATVVTSGQIQGQLIASSFAMASYPPPSAPVESPLRPWPLGDAISPDADRGR